MAMSLEPSYDAEADIAWIRVENYDASTAIAEPDRPTGVTTAASEDEQAENRAKSRLPKHRRRSPSRLIAGSRPSVC